MKQVYVAHWNVIVNLIIQFVKGIYESMYLKPGNNDLFADYQKRNKKPKDKANWRNCGCCMKWREYSYSEKYNQYKNSDKQYQHKYKQFKK